MIKVTDQIIFISSVFLCSELSHAGKEAVPEPTAVCAMIMLARTLPWFLSLELGWPREWSQPTDDVTLLLGVVGVQLLGHSQCAKVAGKAMQWQVAKVDFCIFQSRM